MKGLPTRGNLVAALETAEASPSSPPLEGEAPHQRLRLRGWEREGTTRATTQTHQLPAPLSIQARGRSKGRMWLCRRKLRQQRRRVLSGSKGALGTELKPLRCGEKVGLKGDGGREPGGGG
jgi:hypothetical protein